MLYKIFADFVVLVHFLWILFLIFGALLGIRNKAIKYIHLSSLIFAIIIQIFDWYCPLTHFEFWLRSRHNPSIAYAGSFIIPYVVGRLVYLEISQTMVLVFTIFLSLFNLWVYLRMRKQR